MGHHSLGLRCGAQVAQGFTIAICKLNPGVGIRKVSCTHSRNDMVSKLQLVDMKKNRAPLGCDQLATRSFGNLATVIGPLACTIHAEMTPLACQEACYLAAAKDFLWGAAATLKICSDIINQQNLFWPASKKKQNSGVSLNDHTNAGQGSKLGNGTQQKHTHGNTRQLARCETTIRCYVAGCFLMQSSKCPGAGQHLPKAEGTSCQDSPQCCGGHVPEEDDKRKRE